MKLRGFGLGAFVFGALAASALPSLAQEIPNLVGTWKGTAQAVYVGENPYRLPERAGPNMPAKTIEFTFTISEQQGNRISGQSTASGHTETLIGAISPNNQGGTILDDDGQYLFTIRDTNTLDVCYSHLKPNDKVVACYAWKRAK
jgi:hypothetical protein